MCTKHGSQYVLFLNSKVIVIVLSCQLCPTLCDPMDCSLPDSSVRGDSPGQNTGVGCHVLLQGIVPTQRSNPGLLHCRWILYHLSHQASTRILEWVDYPFSRGTSWPRNRTGVSCIAGRSLPSCAPGKPHPRYHLGSPKMQGSCRPNYIEHVSNSIMFSLILSTLTVNFPLMIGRGNK